MNLLSFLFANFTFCPHSFWKFRRLLLSCMAVLCGVTKQLCDWCFQVLEVQVDEQQDVSSGKKYPAPIYFCLESDSAWWSLQKFRKKEQNKKKKQKQKNGWVPLYPKMFRSKLAFISSFPKTTTSCCSACSIQKLPNSKDFFSILHVWIKQDPPVVPFFTFFFQIACVKKKTSWKCQF